MKKIFFLSFVLFSMQFVVAQDRIDSVVEKEGFQAVYVEVGRGSLMYSLNYERRFSDKIGAPSFYAGAGLFAYGDNRTFTLPVGVNFLFGKSRSFFEVQVGATYFYNKDAKPNRGVHHHVSVDSGYNYYESYSDSPFDRIWGADGQRIYGTLGVGYRWHPGDFLLKAGLTTVCGVDRQNKLLFFPFYPGVAFGYCF